MALELTLHTCGNAAIVRAVSLFERVIGSRFPERAGTGPGVPATTTKPAGTAGVVPVPWLDARSALGLSAVWRCVTLIADSIADMPWTEWDGDGPNARQLTPPSRLVRRPLATYTRRWWTWRVVATEALFNVCHLLHIGGSDSSGRPWSLLPVPPASILPTGGVDPYGMTSPTNYYVAGIGPVTDSQLSIVHRAPVPNMPEYLSGILDLARRQFTAYLAADVHMARYWIHGGPTTTVITTDQELEPTDADRIAQRWVDRRTMGSDWPAVLGKGADAKPWGADPTSESAVESRREVNADVGRYFGVPTRILNAPAGDSETYSNVEHDAIDLYRYTLRGYAGPIEDTVSELLPGDYITGRRMRVDPSRFVEGSLPDRANAWSTIVAAKIAEPEEARPHFGLPPAGYNASSSASSSAPNEAPAIAGAAS